MIFESHAHYDDEAFDADREAILEQCQREGIEYIVNVSASLKTVKSTLALAERYPFIYAAVGVHPDEVGELNEKNFAWMEEQCRNPKTVAVGEIGLDYYWEEPEHSVQKIWFVRQLDLARKVKLPVIIHSRDAAKDTLDIMKAEKAGDMGGVVHCFSYGKEIAREYLDMGFFLGIGGVSTFNNAKKLKEVVEYAPLESLVLETDCPYLSPVPNRGKRNSSLNLSYVVDAVSALKGVDRETVIRVTWDNALRLYGMQH